MRGQVTSYSGEFWEILCGLARFQGVNSHFFHFLIISER